MKKASYHSQKGHTLMDAVFALTLVGIIISIVMSAQSYYFTALKRAAVTEACQEMMLDFFEGYRTLTEIQLAALHTGRQYKNRFCRIEIRSIPSPVNPNLILRLSSPKYPYITTEISLDYRLAR